MIRTLSILRYRSRRVRFRFAFRVACLAGVTLVAGCSGQPAAEVGRGMGPSLPAVRAEPVVRVRVAQGLTRVQVDAPGGVRIGPASQPEQARVFPAAVVVSRRPDALVLAPVGGPAVSWPLTPLLIEPARTESVLVNGTAYPRRVVIQPVTVNPDPVAAGTRVAAGVPAFDVVNHAPLEEYLPGVLDRELYRAWDPGAFRAQAVAARSYALYSAARNTRKHFDVEATTVSQAYAGAVTNPKALGGVRDTRGLVLTYGGYILPAYYSSATGGTGQDAAVAFPEGANIPPLRGRYHGGWEADCRFYRWELTRSADDLARRLAAWGRENKHPLAGLRGLAAVAVSARNAAGRPAQFTVTDAAGGRYTLGPEAFRFACNEEGPGLPPLADDARLKSSHVTVEVVGRTVRFTDGRGYGHGVGLSQWGAQAMAVKGYDYPEILAFYYPGATLRKAY